jgi:cytochrome b subunit of formate dehydrogenase
MTSSSKFFYGVMCAAGVVLALTGIGTYAIGHPPMTHWVLMTHVAVAPLFALALAAVALTWPGACTRDAGSGLSGMAKFLFWVILLCGLVVLLTGVVPMTPVFGARGQHALYLLHRYSALVLTVAVLLHLPALFRRPAAKV